MSARTFADATTVDPVAVPDSIDSPQAKLVYLYLRTTAGATVEELDDSLDLKRLALFPVLDTLESRDLIDRDGERYVAS